MSAPRFDWAEAEALIGPAAMEKARRLAEEAPPLSPELIARLRALVASTPRRPESPAA